MLKLLPDFLLLLIALISIALNKTYMEFTPVELKRRARDHDELAARLYKAVVYTKELSLLLWLIAILCASSGLVLLTRGLSFWFAFLLVVVILWFSFTWLPYVSVPPVNYLAVLLAPAFGWLLERLHPVLRRLVIIFSHMHNAKPNKLYQIDDLLDLLHEQGDEKDNRIPLERLDMASRALTFWRCFSKRNNGAQAPNRYGEVS